MCPHTCAPVLKYCMKQAVVNWLSKLTVCVLVVWNWPLKEDVYHWNQLNYKRGLFFLRDQLNFNQYHWSQDRKTWRRLLYLFLMFSHGGWRLSILKVSLTYSVSGLELFFPRSVTHPFVSQTCLYGASLVLSYLDMTPPKIIASAFSYSQESTANTLFLVWTVQSILLGTKAGRLLSGKKDSLACEIVFKIIIIY